MEPSTSKTPDPVINIEDINLYEGEHVIWIPCSRGLDENISEDFWKSDEQDSIDSAIDEMLRKVPWGKFVISLMPTIEDDALLKTLETCWTIDKTDYSCCKFTLPMFATKHIQKYLSFRKYEYLRYKERINENLSSNVQESLDFMDSVLKKVDTRNLKLKLPPKWSNKMIFSWLGHVNIAMALLDKGTSATVRCNDGSTAAVCAASVKIVEELRKLGANSRKWNIQKNYTALHCAAAVGCVVTTKYLMNLSIPDDVDGKRVDNYSPLHYAVINNAADCVEFLLTEGASPIYSQVYTETPLHVAAWLGNVRCTDLLLNEKTDVMLQLGKWRTGATPLHLAARKGNAECTKLLSDACPKAVEVKNSRKETAMHCATLARSVETLHVLIEANALINAQDNHGRTPLHIAVEKKSSILVKTLIENNALIDKADKSGYTPLHIAAENENSRMALMLLSEGADVTARTNGGRTALSFIVHHTPDVWSRLLKYFDKAISMDDNKLGDINCELKLDFKLLSQYGRDKEDLMICLVEAGEDKVLKHPLFETFLYLKWLHIRKIFLLNLMFHLTFVALFTGYIYVTYIKKEKNKNWLSDILFWSTVSFICVLVGKEIIQIVVAFRNAHKRACIYSTRNVYMRTYERYGTQLVSHIFRDIWNYAQHWKNWMRWSVILMSSIILISPACTWQYHVATLGVLLIWIELMMVISRFPGRGIYIQMFTQVSINFFKLFAAYICIIIGFSFSFSVLHENHEPFKNLLVSLLKTIMMMSGELDFKDIIFPEIDKKNITEGDKKDVEEIDKSLLYPGTAHLMLLSFVCLVTIILMNLVVGLAVADIQELHSCASLDELKRRAEVTAYFESMHSNYKRFIDSFSYIILFKILGTENILTKKINQSFSQIVNWPHNLFIQPNNPREKQLPSKLIKEIYDLVSKKRSQQATFKGARRHTSLRMKRRSAKRIAT